LLLLPLLLLTQSRGAWAALVLASAGMLWLARIVRGLSGGQAGGARWRPVIIPGLFVIGMLLAVSPAMIHALRVSELPAPPQVRQEEDRQALRFTAVSRLYLWRSSLLMLEREPVTGIGLHNFVWRQANREENEGLLIYPGFSHSHNLVLQSALDYGLPGAVAVVGLAAALALSAYGAFTRLSDTALLPLVVGSAGGLAAWGLHGLVDAVAIGSKVGFLPWAVAGLLVGLRVHARRLARESTLVSAPTPTPTSTPTPDPAAEPSPSSRTGGMP
jgi:hypothetical protein